MCSIFFCDFVNCNFNKLLLFLETVCYVKIAIIKYMHTNEIKKNITMTTTIVFSWKSNKLITSLNSFYNCIVKYSIYEDVSCLVVTPDIRSTLNYAKEENQTRTKLIKT